MPGRGRLMSTRSVDVCSWGASLYGAPAENRQTTPADQDGAISESLARRCGRPQVSTKCCCRPGRRGGRRFGQRSGSIAMIHAMIKKDFSSYIPGALFLKDFTWVIDNIYQKYT